MLQISGFSHAFLFCGHKREPLVHSCGLRNVLFVHQKCGHTETCVVDCSSFFVLINGKKILISEALIQRLKLCFVIPEI